MNSKPQEPAIWSSSTLYDKKVKQMREAWFKNWQTKNAISQTSILDFHHTAGIGDPFLDVLMNRTSGWYSEYYLH